MKRNFTGFREAKTATLAHEPRNRYLVNGNGERQPASTHLHDYGIKWEIKRPTTTEERTQKTPTATSLHSGSFLDWKMLHYFRRYLQAFS